MKDDKGPHSGKIRELALLGARTRLAELEQQVKETKELIQLLQGLPVTKDKPLAVNGRKKGKRRKHSDAFKTKVVEEAVRLGIGDTSRKYELSRSMVDKWVSKTKPAKGKGG